MRSEASLFCLSTDGAAWLQPTKSITTANTVTNRTVSLSYTRADRFFVVQPYLLADVPRVSGPVCVFTYAGFYAVSRRYTAPSGPTRTMNGSAVVVIGVDRRGVGRDNTSNSASPAQWEDARRRS